jgi:hypothetical protein
MNDYLKELERYRDGFSKEDEYYDIVDMRIKEYKKGCKDTEDKILKRIIIRRKYIDENYLKGKMKTRWKSDLYELDKLIKELSSEVKE